MQSTILSQEIELDTKQAVSLGFGSAGWKEFRDAQIEKGVTLYTSTNSIIPDELSLYKRFHGDEVLEKKSQGKSVDVRSVNAAMNEVEVILLKIKELTTIEALIKRMVFTVWQMNVTEAEEEAEIKQAVLQQEDPARTMLAYLKELHEGVYGKQNEFDTRYNFIRTVGKVAAQHLQGTDAKLKEELNKWISYVDVERSGMDTQKILAQSKRVLVDTLQYNLKALQSGKPLIPITFVLSSKESKSMFLPDWIQVTQKRGGVSFTNAEIRMAYKLLEEINDPLIHEVIKKTMFFYSKIEKGFEQINSPWEIVENQQEWIKRTRTEGKKAYKDRPPLEVQKWVKELINLSQETARSLQLQQQKKPSF